MKDKRGEAEGELRIGEETHKEGEKNLRKDGGRFKVERNDMKRKA